MIIIVVMLKNKKVLIVGFGKSGKATANFLAGKIAELSIWDDSEAGRLEIKKAGFNRPNSTDEINFNDLDFIVWSPGIPHYGKNAHELAVRAKSKNCPLICDIDLFYQCYPSAKYIGITGSNGKSTSVSLLKHVFDKLEKTAFLGGNIGQAIFTQPDPKNNFVILELSSYQLELSPHLKLEIGALLNITPDHLARHYGYENYIKAKEEILKKSVKKIICTDTIEAKKLGKKYDATLISTTEKIETNYLKGIHNSQNINVVSAITDLIKLNKKQVEKAIASFKGLAHRQEFVLEKNGIKYINDSKATNAEAIEPALKTFSNIYLIAGGQAKEGGLETVLPLIKEKVKAVFLIGNSADLFAKQLENIVPFYQCKTLENAVKIAQEKAVAPATVLLSPACASWDQFDSFEHRGDAFKKIVQKK
ncbi:MAG: UDP-N-acetylmuramoyl-L-alanine--D-glutamate ligase [Alphaproteobacteria bacterium]|nr:MAG: UDP-N-acetylmuramoyl-L-alanine--D-glutamate ligase [Rickettsiaceae bacterium 4572_127]